MSASKRIDEPPTSVERWMSATVVPSWISKLKTVVRLLQLWRWLALIVQRPLTPLPWVYILRLHLNRKAGVVEGEESWGCDCDLEFGQKVFAPLECQWFCLNLLPWRLVVTLLRPLRPHDAQRCLQIWFCLSSGSQFPLLLLRFDFNLDLPCTQQRFAWQL